MVAGLVAWIALLTGQAGSTDPAGALDAEGPILLPYHGPASGGVAYRLTLEI